MTVLVSGGAGYLGTVIIRRLLDSGYRVRCLDQRAHEPGLRRLLGEQDQGRLELVRGDIRDREAVLAAVKDITACVHLAAVVGYPACDGDPDAARTTNVEGTRILAQNIDRGLPFIFMSTCSVYGYVRSGVCREEEKAKPLSFYGETKLIAETIVRNRGGVALRATTAYGPSPRFRWDLIVHNFIRLGLAGETLRLYQPYAVRPFIHVDDIASAVCFALSRVSALLGNAYNLGSDDATLTKLDLAQLIAEVTGLSIEVDPISSDADGRDYRVAFDRIEALGFPSRRPFRESLAQTVNWARRKLP